MSNPEKDVLKVSSPGMVQRVAAEGVGERDQLWVAVQFENGSEETYFRYLDEGLRTTIDSQVGLVQASLVHGLPVLFHYEDHGNGKEFHAITLIR